MSDTVTSFSQFKIPQEIIQGIDATPDNKYPIRILRAYREYCNCFYSDNTEGEPRSELWEQMNEWQRERALILDKAIQLLEKEL